MGHCCSQSRQQRCRKISSHRDNYDLLRNLDWKLKAAQDIWRHNGLGGHRAGNRRKKSNICLIELAALICYPCVQQAVRGGRPQTGLRGTTDGCFFGERRRSYAPIAPHCAPDWRRRGRLAHSQTRRRSRPLKPATLRTRLTTWYGPLRHDLALCA